SQAFHCTDCDRLVPSSSYLDRASSLLNLPSGIGDATLTLPPESTWPDGSHRQWWALLHPSTLAGQAGEGAVLVDRPKAGPSAHSHLLPPWLPIFPRLPWLRTLSCAAGSTPSRTTFCPSLSLCALWTCINGWRRWARALDVAMDH